jgi:hypothetical protein
MVVGVHFSEFYFVKKNIKYVLVGIITVGLTFMINLVLT